MKLSQEDRSKLYQFLEGGEMDPASGLILLVNNQRHEIRYLKDMLERAMLKLEEFKELHDQLMELKNNLPHE